MKKENIIYAYWCLSPNFGDALTPYILNKMTGKEVAFSPTYSDVPKYMLTGSILNHECTNAIVWGAGIANDSDNITIRNVVATRGFNSLFKAKLNGVDISKTLVGDPCLIMPMLYKPAVEKKYRVGILPHYVDAEVVTYGYELAEDVLLINVLDPVEKVIDDICSCEKVVSSSLHGLIACDAYKIPNKWVTFSVGRILGDGFKYYDYYSTTRNKLSTMAPTDFKQVYDNNYNVPFRVNMTKLDLQKFYDSAPFLQKN